MRSERTRPSAPPVAGSEDSLESGADGRGTPRDEWSRADLERLRELYGLRPDEAIARELDRPVASVLDMVRSLLPTAMDERPWTASETLLLERCLMASAPSDLIARILGRSPQEVDAHVHALGHGEVWARNEIAEFKRAYGSSSDDELARRFGKTLLDVQRLANEHRLSKNKAYLSRIRGKGATRMPRWNAAELDVLKELYPTQPNIEVARRLDRSVPSVVSKAHHLHLRKTSERLQEMGRSNVSVRYTS